MGKTYKDKRRKYDFKPLKRKKKESEDKPKKDKDWSKNQV